MNKRRAKLIRKLTPSLPGDTGSKSHTYNYNTIDGERTFTIHTTSGWRRRYRQAKKNYTRGIK